MAEQVDRRNFLKTSMAAAAGAAYAANSGLGANPQSAIRNPQSEPTGVNGMPMGQIKNLKVSRLISGGNLISGWAHSRDLIYVHSLMDHYNTEEKVLETLAVLEENGVNTIIADPRKKPMDVFKKHWQRGRQDPVDRRGTPDAGGSARPISRRRSIGARRPFTSRASSATAGSRRATSTSSASASSTSSPWACRAASAPTCST